MKKAILIVLALTMVLTMAACGGKDNSGNNDPLNREDGNPSSTAGTSIPAGNVPDLAGAIGGTGKLSDYDAATRQAMIDAAKAEGGNLEFKADGSVVYTDPDGSKAIQKPDGTWTYEDEDGNTGQMGGDWPDNEYTKLIPKPDFAYTVAGEQSDRFSVAFTNVTIEEIRAYTQKVKEKGFTIEPSETDQELAGMVVFTYTAKNAAGYEVRISSASGYTGIEVIKP